MNLERLGAKWLTFLRSQSGIIWDFMGEKWPGVIFHNSIELFAENEDHGLPHSLSVYRRAGEINGCSGESVNMLVVGAMCLLHDFVRFFVPDESDLLIATLPDGREPFEVSVQQNHEALGAELAARFSFSSLKRLLKGLPKHDPRTSVSSAEVKKICDGIRHHDFLQRRFGERDRLPSTLTSKRNLEAAIFRFADKTACSPIGEVERSLAIGKRRKTPFFLPRITMKKRLAADFSHFFPEDQLTFFLMGLLGLTPEDFHFDFLRAAYAEWRQGIGEAIERILVEAESPEVGCDRGRVEKVISGYIKAVEALYER